MKQPITFRNGQQVCPLGQGTYQMGRRRNEEIKALRRGVDLGLTLIDTAEMYGTEDLVGEAVRDCREQAFIVSKVLPSNASYEGTKRACAHAQGAFGRVVATLPRDLVRAVSLPKGERRRPVRFIPAAGVPGRTVHDKTHRAKGMRRLSASDIL